METKINATTTLEALANLCQQWADSCGIALVGTYSQMARMGGYDAATFRAFAKRAKQLQRETNANRNANN